jgi:hypothetical protein
VPEWSLKFSRGCLHAGGEALIRESTEVLSWLSRFADPILHAFKNRSGPPIIVELRGKDCGGSFRQLQTANEFTVDQAAMLKC